jgi:methylated-DNA-[protein]-cysteine S-methyltransferase
METFTVNMTSRVGTWGVEGSEYGLSRVYMPNEPHRVSRGAIPEIMADAARQLSEYFAGSRRSFSVRLADAASTPFQRDVWDALLAIPYGETRTYAEVAASAKRPRAARAVGNANHANPWPIIVPCHRVVGAESLGGYGGGDEVKRFLLELEGVSLLH